MDYDDLAAYGELGLAEAARDFDPEQGTRFTTFAYYRVRGAIYDGLSKMSWTSRARYRRHRYERMANEVLAQDAEQNPPRTGASLAEETSWFGDVTEKLAVVYLASQECDDSRGGPVFEDPHDSAGTLVARQEISERLHQLVNGLPELERQIVQTIYFDGATLQQAADHLSVSKSWASRLHARALEKLARALRPLGVQDKPRARLR